MTMQRSASVRTRLVSGSAWTLAGKLLAAGAGLVASALLARLLAPGELGSYFLTLTVILFGSTVALMGMRQTVVRLVAASIGTNEPGRARAAVHSSFRVVLVAGLLVAAIVSLGLGQWLAGSVFHSASVSNVIVPASFCLLAVAILSLVSEVFRGLSQMRFATLFADVWAPVASAILLGVLWILRGHASLVEVVLLSFAATATGVLVGGLLLFPRVHRLSGPGTTHAKELLVMGWPLLVTDVTLILVGGLTDLWIIAAFLPRQDVALYGAAARLVVLVLLPLQILQAVTPPLIAELYAQGKRGQLERMVRVATAFACVPSVAVLVVFLAAGRSIMGAMFGPFYEQGVGVLLIMSVSRLVAVWTGPCGVALMMSGHQRVVMKITIFGGVLSVAGDLLLVRPYGIVGVAVATSAAAILVNLVQWYAVKRLVGIWTHAEMSPSRIISAARSVSFHG
jgi:O-antigen/teichoic acid export membrane protein